MELESLGKYRLVGPMQVADATSDFYLARHADEPENDPPTYVVKLLAAGRGGDIRRRRGQFEHQARLLQAFNHACIPTVHAAGDQDGVAYLVMDRVEGIDLATLLDLEGPNPRRLSKELAVYIMGQLADALHHIHSVETMEDDGPQLLGVVHRNIKPSHVLLSSTGDAVLCGFGSARSRWLPSAWDDPAAGDLGYMSPERLAGEPARVDTDLFALAVVLWEMLRGTRCLAGPDDAATRENIQRFDIAQSSRRVSGLSSKLSEVMRKNLDRDPGRRYEGAYQMLQRLAQSPEAASAEASRARLGELVRQAMSARG